MEKLADGLYHQRRAAGLLAGHLDPDGWVDAGSGRRWRQPDISRTIQFHPLYPWQVS